MQLYRPNFWQILCSLFILGIAFLFFFFLLNTSPHAQTEEPQTSVALVETLLVHPQEIQTSFTAYGTVRAQRELQLRPEVSGRVVQLSDDFLVGGLLEKNQTLLQIDPRDYEAAVDREKGLVAQARFDLQLEEGRQIIAKKEFDLLGTQLPNSKISEELALRKPHLEEKKAALQSAESQLQKALTDLERCTLRSPFNAVILSEDVEVGQILSPQTPIATLASTDQFWVQVSLSYSQLSWLEIPLEIGEQGSSATVIQELPSSQNREWPGYITGLLGDVDPAGRMVRLLVAVEDPFELNQSKARRHPLLLGTYVRVDLLGPLLPQVFSLPRNALRDEESLWIKTPDHRLEIRPVKILLKQKDTVLLREGLTEGEEVIISSIPNAVEGMPLKRVKESPHGS